jgi:8-amino-7-oxononanoate synthase
MFQNQLEKIKQKGTFRQLPNIGHQGKYVIQEGKKMLNVSSNDYLGLAGQSSLHKEFEEYYYPEKNIFSASSARLLTGNYGIYNELETFLAEFYEREAVLLFNSGYHANVGILPALTTASSLILADKLVHASIIDGISLCRAKTIRYRHNDYEQLERLLQENASKHDYVFVATESIFSMDGDICDLQRLVSLKKQFSNVLLYVDEAHAVGVRGIAGRGVSEEQQVMRDIDIIVGTFGKALASVGAFAVTNREIKEVMINSVRSFIFTTALPPVNICWSKFIMEKIPFMTKEREHLQALQQCISESFPQKEISSHIFPFLIGDSEKSVFISEKLKEKGYYALPIRPPTVPEGSARIRISLTAQLTVEEVKSLMEAFKLSTTP